MIEVVQAPTFRGEDFDAAGKRPGLSAIVRLSNEEDFAEASLNSILPYFDEIVVVFNDCTDRTPEIVAEFEHQNPKRVRAFQYGPRVYPPGSEAHRRLPANSVHSLVHYYNFALSKASYQVRCKWDGDQIAEPESFGAVVRRLRRIQRGTREWWLSPWQWGYWWYVGVNLWDSKGQVAVPRTRPMIGQAKDHGFWPAQRWIRFKHHPHFEYLFTHLLVHRYVGCLFFHLKGMKRDRGIGVYRLDENPESPYVDRVKTRWTDPPLQAFADFQAGEPIAKDMPTPTALGIHPIVTR
jgi:glycosyltransferase involved in cell wall biosynthesis